MSATIIIPIETKRNCIEQAGKLFCEQTDVSWPFLGWIIIGVLAFIGWVLLWLWAMDNFEWCQPHVMVLGAISPVLIFLIVRG